MEKIEVIINGIRANSEDVALFLSNLARKREQIKTHRQYGNRLYITTI